MRELYREFASFRLRAKDETQRDIAWAWHVVKIRIDAENKHELSPLSTYLTGGEVTKRQSVQDMKTQLSLIGAQHGIALRKSTGPTKVAARTMTETQRGEAS